MMDDHISQFIIQSKCFPHRYPQIVEKFQILKLTKELFAPFQESCTFFIMGVGLFGLVFFVFITLKFYSLLPFLVYIYFPLVVVIICVIINLTLPFAQKITEKSVTLIQLWKKHCKEKNLKRKLAAVRPLYFYAAINGLRFFTVSKEIKVKYFSKATEYTILMLITIPMHSLENKILE